MVPALLVAIALFGSQMPAPTGIVQDATGLPLPGAVIAMKNSDRFVVSDERGVFTLPQTSGDLDIVVSLPGFEARQVRVSATNREPIVVVLTLSGVSEMVAVRAAPPPTAAQVTLTPIDVVRTPGAQADLMRALGMQPGVVHIDDGAGLFVRGGDVSEVLVLLDGVVVNHPYRYETPTGGFRGAIDPFMTQGASFTSGGFAAQYGNSLSAVVDMQGLSRPRERQMNLTAGLAGISASIASPLGARTGVRLGANRTTPSLLFAVNRNSKRFDELPGGWDVSGSVTVEHPRLGTLRAMALTQRDHVGVELEKDAFVGFLHSATRHQLTTVRWEKAFSGWMATASAGQDDYTKSTDVGVLAVDEGEQHRSARAQISGGAGGWQLQTGADVDAIKTSVEGRIPSRGGDFEGISGSDAFLIAHRDWRAGVFGVASRAVAAVTPEFSVRVDKFDAAGAFTADPRMGVRIAIANGHVFRLAAGRYHQAPAASYFDQIRGASMLRPMTATHYVAGYEAGSINAPVFARVEVYHKTYRDLPVEDDASGFSSSGHGSASGVDVFLRRIWPRLDLTLTGSALHAQRRWTSPEQRERYPLPAGTWTPDFAIPLAVQATAHITLTQALSAGASWRTVAGKPFTPATGAKPGVNGFEPIWAPINSDRLPRYERLDLSISLIKPFGARANAIFFASVDNVLDRSNAFDVAYSADYSTRRPVTTSSPRSFYIGCSITR